MAIVAKKSPTIKKGNGFAYIPDTFEKEHGVSFFKVTEDPQEIIDNIKPFEIDGRKFMVFDTETHPFFKNSQEVPKFMTRRWVGSGKKATPQDLPFCISICDGTTCWTIYDDLDNGFEKFKALSVIFEDASIEKIAHNTKFDMHMLANIGMKIVGRLHDTVVLAKLANENRTSFKLRDLAERHPDGIVKFEYMVDSYKQLNKVTDYRNFPRPLLSNYANADVWNAYLIFCQEFDKVAKEELMSLYDNECEIMIVLYAMERYGMQLDTDYEDTLKSDLRKLTDDAEAAIYAEAGKVFNINSTKQLYEVLLDVGVDPSLIKMTPKGNPSLDKDALNNLANRGINIVSNILEYRKYEKLLTTYAEGIYAQRDSADVVHGSINQTEATTGRMSITKPALQTLPKKDTSIRKSFIPEAFYSLVFMDLDQIEYRLFAHYAQIPSLLEAIANGYDVHAATASVLFNVDLEELLERIHNGDKEASDLRSKAKTINFALIYGVGNDHLAEMLVCSTTEAGNIKTRYFANLPEAKSFINTVHGVIKLRGFVKNFYGRRRRLDSNDCYKAPNALIQGCAADYIKFKTVEMYKYLKYNNLKTHMVNIVHDENVINVHESETEHIPVLRYLMSDFESFRCPITAGVEFGNPSWGEKVEKEVGFEEPDNFDFLEYNVYDGSVFDINREDVA